MINRSRLLIVLFTVFTFLPANVFSARRRQPGFVGNDRFVRPNPFRVLANKIASSLPIEIYYPTPPPDNQLHQFPPQPHSRPSRPFATPHYEPKPPLSPYVGESSPPPYYERQPPLSPYRGESSPPRYYAPEKFRASSPYYAPNDIRTHYTKMPASRPMYYSSDMTTSFMQTQGPPARIPTQPQNLFLHGVGYPVSSLQHPQNLKQMPPVVRVQQAVPLPGYQSPPMTYVQQQPSSVSYNYVPQNGPSYAGQQQSYYTQQSYMNSQSPSSNHLGPTQPDPMYYSAPEFESFMTQPEPGSSDDVPSETTGLLSLPEETTQYSPNEQLSTEGLQEQSSAVDSNMLNVFVIRPQDMERLKSASDAEREELLRGYSTKYIDVEQGAQELVLRPTGSENPMQMDTQDESETCIQPLCDPFLGKIIPELISSANLNNNLAGPDNDPILIVKKNRNNNSYKNVDPFLQNHRSDDVGLPEDMQGMHGIPEFTVMRAIDESDGSGSAVEIMQGQHSTLKPQRVKIHFPNRKLLSAKMNSTTVRKYEPQAAPAPPVVRTYKTSVADKLRLLQQTRSEKSSATSLEKNATTNPPIATFAETPAELQALLPKVKELEVEKSQPYFRRGSLSKKMPTQKTVTDGNNPNEDAVKILNDRDEQRKKLKSARYTTAGILFNNSKVAN